MYYWQRNMGSGQKLEGPGNFWENVPPHPPAAESLGVGPHLALVEALMKPNSLHFQASEVVKPLIPCCPPPRPSELLEFHWEPTEKRQRSTFPRQLEAQASFPLGVAS